MNDEEIAAFGRTFAAFMEHVVHRAGASEGPLVERLRGHLGVDPLTLPIISAIFAPFEHPDVQLAVDEYMQDRRRTGDAFGLSGSGRRHLDVSELLGTHHFAIGPVVRTEMPVDVNQTMACIEFGFLLVRGPDDPPHVLVLRIEERGTGPDLHLDVMSADTDHAKAVLTDIRTRVRTASVYRGKVFSLSRPHDDFERSIGASFMPVPPSC